MACLTCKPSVRFKDFPPAMIAILSGLSAVARATATVPELVITSANDSTHAPTSRHYAGEAVDIRSKHFPSAAAREAFAAALRQQLGPAFTVLLEDDGGPNEHLHIQPKKGTAYVVPTERAA